jgi:hypothetical protein
MPTQEARSDAAAVRRDQAASGTVPGQDGVHAIVRRGGPQPRIAPRRSRRTGSPWSPVPMRAPQARPLSPPAAPDRTCRTMLTRDGVSARNRPVTDYPATRAGTEAEDAGRASRGTRTLGRNDASRNARGASVSGIVRMTAAETTKVSVRTGNIRIGTWIGDGALAVAIITTLAQTSTAKDAPRPRRRPSRGWLTRFITLSFVTP